MRRCDLRDVAYVVSVSAAIAISGCSAEVATNNPPASPPSADKPVHSPPESEVPAAESGASAADDKQDITLKVVDKAGLQQAIDKHRGKVVLVDVWATWCTPCIKLFPHTVELHNKYAGKGLAVISLSMDDSDAEAEALAFLKEQKATFTNLRSKRGAEAEAFEDFDIDGGALPHFKLYDRQGKPVKKLTSGEAAVPPEAADVQQAVEQLLSE